MQACRQVGGGLVSVARGVAVGRDGWMEAGLEVRSGAQLEGGLHFLGGVPKEGGKEGARLAAGGLLGLLRFTSVGGPWVCG